MVYSTTANDPGTASDATRSERIRRLQRISRITRLMDTAVRVPVVGVRLGADSIMGLIPGVGDAAGGLIGLFIVNEARRLGLPRAKLLRMVGNLLADTAIGSVPIAGDVFDVYFKSHRRNAKIVLDHFGEPDGAELDLDGMKDVTPRPNRA